VVEREREMDEQLVRKVFGAVALFDFQVDVGNTGCYAEHEHECENVMMLSPEMDVRSIEKTEEGQGPPDAINDDLFPRGEELLDHSPKQKEVYNSPDIPSPGRGSDIRLLPMVIVPTRGTESVHIRTKEEDVHRDVRNLQNESIRPRG